MKRKTLLLITLIFFSGVISAQNPQWLHYTNGDNINALAEEGNSMWAGTNGGLVKLDIITGTQVCYTTSNSGLPDNDIRSIAIDGNGTKWIGTYRGGLASFDGSNWTVYNTSNSGLPLNYVTTIAIDQNGTKWIGTYGGFYGGGLASFDGSYWTVYNTSNSDLPDNNIHSIAIDENGTKWIGTMGGLVAFDGSN